MPPGRPVNAVDGSSFWLDLPPDWLVLDPGSGRVLAQVAALVQRAVAKDPAVAAHRGMIESEIRAVVAQARSGDLSFCAMLATVVNDVLPMMATLTVAHRAVRDGADTSSMLSTLRRRPGAAVTRVQLASAGTAVRAVFRDKARGGGLDRPVQAAVCQYFIPTRSGVVVVTGATPLLPLAEHFADLFDAIADSFTFTAADAARAAEVPG